VGPDARAGLGLHCRALEVAVLRTAFKRHTVGGLSRHVHDPRTI
jgi:hypothetical protein